MPDGQQPVFASPQEQAWFGGCNTGCIVLLRLLPTDISDSHSLHRPLAWHPMHPRNIRSNVGGVSLRLAMPSPPPPRVGFLDTSGGSTSNVQGGAERLTLFAASRPLHAAASFASAALVSLS